MAAPTFSPMLQASFHLCCSDTCMAFMKMLAVGTIAPSQTGCTSLGLTQTPAMAAPTFSPMLQASP